jgi:MFS family permease
MSYRRNLMLGRLSSFFTMFLIVVPILVPFWKSLGLSMQEILEIQGIFGLSVAIFELPTGYVADLWSRKASVCVGTFISGCGFSLIPFATTYETILLYEVIIGLGCSLVSGADISLVYDSIKDDPNRLKHLGSLTTWGLVGEALAGITASILILWSYTPILWAQVIAGWAPFVISLFYVEPPLERMKQASHFSNFSSVVRHIMFGDRIARMVFINALIWGLSSFCVVWLLQPYWAEKNVPIAYFGFLWSGLMFVAAGASSATHAIERRWGAVPVLATLSLSAVVGYFVMAFSNGWLGVVAGGLFYINRGLASVMFTDAFNWKIPSSFRATANSMRSLAFRLSYVFIGPATGLLIDARGLSNTLAIMGCIATLMFVMFMVPLCRQFHELSVGYIPDE